jgi:hypothetical protein
MLTTSETFRQVLINVGFHPELVELLRKRDRVIVQHIGYLTLRRPI